MGIVRDAYIEKVMNDAEARRNALQRYQDYYDGDHDVKLPDEVKNVSPIVDNVCQTVVDDPVTLLVGTAPDISLNDNKADTDDKEPERWLRNEVLLPSRFSTSLLRGCRVANIKGEAWIYIYWDERYKAPRLKILRPDIIYPIVDEMDYEELLGLVIKYPRDNGSVYCAIWTPETFEEYETDDKSHASSKNLTEIRRTWRSARGKTPEQAVMTNPYGFIPFRQFKVKAVDSEFGVSCLQPLVSTEKVMGMQDALNKGLTDMIKMLDSQAFRHLWATGITTDDVANFKQGANKLWYTTNPDAQFGAIENTDPMGSINAINLLLERISKVTATPVQAFYKDNQAPQSGKALRIQRFDQIQKVNEQRTLLEEAIIDAIKMALQMEAMFGSHDYVDFIPSVNFHDGMPIDRKEIAEIHEIEARNGWKSNQTIMGERGIEDVEAERKRIEEEHEAREARANRMAALSLYGHIDENNDEDENDA